MLATTPQPVTTATRFLPIWLGAAACCCCDLTSRYDSRSEGTSCGGQFDAFPDIGDLVGMLSFTDQERLSLLTVLSADSPGGHCPHPDTRIRVCGALGDSFSITSWSSRGLRLLEWGEKLALGVSHSLQHYRRGWWPRHMQNNGRSSWCPSPSSNGSIWQRPTFSVISLSVRGFFVSW